MRQLNAKLIITVAINGSLATKEHNPNVPVTPEEVVADTVGCWEAGAAVVHIHARDEEQRPSHDYDFFAECVRGIREQCDIIIQLSTGARGPVDRETRIRAVDLRPDMMSLSCGCTNFADGPFLNTLEDIEYWLGRMNEYGVKPELECFDLSHIYTSMQMMDRGLIEDPALFNLIFGVPGSLPFTPGNFAHMWSCVPRDALINTIGVGRYQLPVTTMSTALGGNVRVGLEDNLYYSYRVLASNRQLVERAVRIGRECQREITDPAEARGILGI